MVLKFSWKHRRLAPLCRVIGVPACQSTDCRSLPASTDWRRPTWCSDAWPMDSYGLHAWPRPWPGRFRQSRAKTVDPCGLQTDNWTRDEPGMIRSRCGRRGRRRSHCDGPSTWMNDRCILDGQQTQSVFVLFSLTNCLSTYLHISRTRHLQLDLISHLLPDIAAIL